jgi:hypothetical protein
MGKSVRATGKIRQINYKFWAPFWAADAAQKPGFPLQVLGFAHANPVGFPLQSLTQRQLKIMPRNCHRQFRGIIAASAIMRVELRRSQFCSDKIAWFATKHEAKCTYLSLSAAATTITANGYE